MAQGGMSCVKYILFFFNLVFVILGIVLMVLGFTTKYDVEKYVHFLGESSINVPPNLFIAVGFFIFFISFLGCCGAVKENHCMMMTYSILIGFLLVLEVGAAIAAFTQAGTIEETLHKGLMDSLHEYRNTSDPDGKDVTGFWDLTQNTGKCCGVDSYKDWQTTKLNETYKIPVPTSCCIVDSVNCSLPVKFTDGDEKYIHLEGCFKYIVSDINIQRIGQIGIGLAVVQLFGIIFACAMARHIRYRYETV